MISLFVSLSFPYNHTHGGSNDPIKDYPAWVLWMDLFLPIVLIIYYILYQKRKYDLKTLENGVFKIDLPYNRDTLFEANLCLAIVMIKMDKVDVGLKLNLLRHYFMENFPQHYSLFDDRLNEFYNGKPIKLSAVALWLDKNVAIYSTKSHILYFLAKISMIDGEIIESEYLLLKELAFLLKLEESELDKVLNTYKYYETKKKQEEKKQKSQTSSFTSSKTLIELAFKVLGLEKGASIDEVKSAYRKLAMVHHPDKFSTESEGQQKIAHERFVHINEAYELVLKSF